MHDKLVAEPIRLNYDDFCALPDDGRRYEILDGDLYMSPSPVPLHQRLVGNLHIEIGLHVREHKLGELLVAPVDIILSDHDIVAPDLVFVSVAKSKIVTAKNIVGSPDLFVEVLSPSTSQRDLRDKRNIYARFGVDWYWIVDPNAGEIIELQRVDNAYAEVCRARRGEQFKPGLFQGLVIDVDALWT